MVGEVAAIAAELAGRVAERVQQRIPGIPGLESEIEGLTQVLGQESEGVGAVRPRTRVVVLERLLACRLEAVAERRPGVVQCQVVLTVAECHCASADPCQHGRDGHAGAPRRVQWSLAVDAWADEFQVEPVAVAVLDRVPDESFDGDRAVSGYGAGG